MWEILYCHLWASNKYMMLFWDTFKSERDACQGNDDLKVSKNERHI